MNESPDKSLYWPLDVSITQLVAATFAPDTGASEPKPSCGKDTAHFSTMVTRCILTA